MADTLDSPHERLEWARARAGFHDKAEFAKVAQVHPTTYRAYENGQNGFAKHAATFGRLLGVTAEWLLEGGKEPTSPPPERTAAESSGDDDDDTVEIQEMDFAYGMGGGTYLDLPVTATPQRLSRGLLRSFTQSPPQRIFVARGTGDSMMPTILDGDIVLVDTSENRVLAGDKIWAITYGMAGLIKRLRPMPDGSVKILSDNPSVPPEIAYDGEMTVVGRVVGVLRKT